MSKQKKIASQLEVIEAKDSEWGKQLREIFDSLNSEENKSHLFVCPHCGGFHDFQINCGECKSSNKATKVIKTAKIDHFFCMAVCATCLATSIAVIRCKGIDPAKEELQEAYKEERKKRKEKE
jgi:hypothetical protein